MSQKHSPAPHASPDSPENSREPVVAALDRPCPAPESDNATAADGDYCRDLRSALGCFATGVTVVTAWAADGSPIGVTISSFNSVSLEPPLILWCLSLTSPNLEAFRQASHYAVNVLAADQQHLSDRFAARRVDRFTDLPLHTSLSGVPLLDGCCAWFECSNTAQYPGGDHLIFVGSVERFAQGRANAPLIFHGGGYRRLVDAVR